MLKILDPRKKRHQRILQRGLLKRRAKIYYCQDCEYVFMGKLPKRCADRKCRAPARGKKRPLAVL